MKEDIIKRCEELLEGCRSLVSNIEGNRQYFTTGELPKVQSLVSSSASMISSTVTKDDFYRKECEKIMDTFNKSGLKFGAFLRFSGHFESFVEGLKSGHLGKVEYMFVSITFDDFLDHASSYHKSNKKTEAAILASSVFEDAMRKLADKHGLKKKLKMETIIESIEAFSPTKRKQLKAYAGLRNDALHADYDNFDIKDVGRLIEGTREIIEDYLQ